MKLVSLLLTHNVGNLRDRKVANSASDHHGSNFESCVWRAVSSHHPQEALLDRVGGESEG